MYLLSIELFVKGFELFECIEKIHGLYNFIRVYCMNSFESMTSCLLCKMKNVNGRWRRWLQIRLFAWYMMCCVITFGCDVNCLHFVTWIFFSYVKMLWLFYFILNYGYYKYIFIFFLKKANIFSFGLFCFVLDIIIWMMIK